MFYSYSQQITTTVSPWIVIVNLWIQRLQFMWHTNRTHNHNKQQQQQKVRGNFLWRCFVSVFFTEKKWFPVGTRGSHSDSSRSAKNYPSRFSEPPTWHGTTLWILAWPHTEPLAVGKDNYVLYTTRPWKKDIAHLCPPELPSTPNGNFRPHGMISTPGRVLSLTRTSVTPVQWQTHKKKPKSHSTCQVSVCVGLGASNRRMRMLLASYRSIVVADRNLAQELPFSVRSGSSAARDVRCERVHSRRN